MLYTVEPYQHVSGCETGHGVANDTASTLDYEIAETITDPVNGSG